MGSMEMLAFESYTRNPQQRQMRKSRFVFVCSSRQTPSSMRAETLSFSWLYLQCTEQTVHVLCGSRQLLGCLRNFPSLSLLCLHNPGQASLFPMSTLTVTFKEGIYLLTVITIKINQPSENILKLWKYINSKIISYINYIHYIMM